MSEELNNIRFRDIIAAPLTAIVDAGVIAAKATNDFIKSVGFHEPKNKTGDEFGELRNISFVYTRNDAHDVPTQFRIEVPLLSIMPIPCIEVKSAEIEFSVNLVGVETNSREVDVLNPDSVQAIQNMHPADASRIRALLKNKKISQAAKKAVLEKFVDRNPTLSTGKSLTVNVAQTTKSNSEVSSNYDMKVKVHVQQADIPVGLSKIFTILEESVLERKK
jgi:hypothetical protein